MAKGKEFKKPKTERGKKINPHSSKNVSDEDRHPKFSFRLLQDTRCLSSCTKEQKAALADTLDKLSKLPWKEIRGSHRHAMGFEKIDQNSLRISVPEETKDKNVLAFRFCGMAPMLGVKKQATFYVIWLDTTFEAYPH
jgi:hypothetical protein